MNIPLSSEEQLRLSRERAKSYSAAYYEKNKDRVKARLTKYNEKRRNSQKDNLRTLREGLESVSLQILSLHQTLNELERPRLSKKE